MKHHFPVIIAKIHTVKYHITFQKLIGRRIIGLVIMLPCPASGMLIGFFDLSVFHNRIDKGHIALIQLRFFIKESENPVCAGKCHNHTVELLADLVDRHIDASIKGQKACQCS